MVWSTPARRYPRFSIAAMVDPAGIRPGGGSGPLGRRLASGSQVCAVPRVPLPSGADFSIWTPGGLGSAPARAAAAETAGGWLVPHAVASKATAQVATRDTAVPR